MASLNINSKLYEKIYKELEDYGRASYNHCPGIRLYPHYKDYLSGKIMDLGCGTGETVEFLRNQRFEAFGLDWINPRNSFCKKANITRKSKLGRYSVVTCFDVIEHMTNAQVKALLLNMSSCETQIFTIDNDTSVITLKDGESIELHINRKPFTVWRGIILDYFNIVDEILIRDSKMLYICKKKGSSEEYNEFMAEFLRKKGYSVEKIIKSKLKEVSRGYWFYPVTDFVYDKAYAEKYEGYAETPMGKSILDARLDIIKPYNSLLDIGIGCGTIIDNKEGAKGFDVNPATIEKLKLENRWCDPYSEDLSQFDVISFFDSFEHIEKPEILLNKVTTQTLVIAIPIFSDYNGVISSKHYRPDEHFHYFTLEAFLEYMHKLGFECLDISDIEIELGRESIYTFTFYRGLL